jgi:hypothetical protein
MTQACLNGLLRKIDSLVLDQGGVAQDAGMFEWSST